MVVNGEAHAAEACALPFRVGPTVCVTGDRVLRQADVQRVLDMVGRCLLLGGNRPADFRPRGESFPGRGATVRSWRAARATRRCFWPSPDAIWAPSARCMNATPGGSRSGLPGGATIATWWRTRSRTPSSPSGKGAVGCPPEPGFMQGAAGIAGWLARLYGLRIRPATPSELTGPGPAWL